MIPFSRTLALANIAFNVLFLLFTLLSSHAQAANEVVYLSEGWQMREGDSPVTAQGPAWVQVADASDDTWKPLQFTGQPPTRKPEVFTVWQRIRLPSAQITTPVLHIISVEQNMDIYLDREKIYSFGSINSEGQGNFAGYQWHAIPLPENFSGRMLSFRIFSEHRFIGFNGRLRILPAYSLFEEIIRKSINHLLVSAIAGFLGLLALGVYATRLRDRSYLFFGTFALTLGIYITFRTPIQEVIFPFPYASTFVEFICLFSASTALASYVQALFHTGRRNPVRYIWTILFAYAVFAVIAVALGLVPLMATLAPYQSLILIGIPFIIAEIVRRVVKRDREALVVAIGVGFILASTAGDMLISMGLILSSFKGSVVFLPWGLLGLILAFASVLVLRVAHVFKQTVKHKRNLEELTQEGRHLASQTTIPQLTEQIRASFSQITHQALINEIFMASEVINDQSLPPGFYRLNDDGSIAEGGAMDRETVTKANPFILPVNDPRTNRELALVPLTLPPNSNEESESEILQLLEPLSNNIASAITTVRLEQTLNSLDRRTHEIQTLFKSIRQGILTIDADGNIGREYSTHLEDIIGKTGLAGQCFLTTILSHTNLGHDAFAQVKSTLSATLNESILSWISNTSKLPTAVEFINDKGEQLALELDWTPLIDDEIVERVMVTIRDVTTLRTLQREAGENKAETQILIEIFSAGLDPFSAFVKTAREFVAECREIAADLDSEQLQVLRRHLHTIKGNARLLQLSLIANRTHEAESTTTTLIDELASGNLPPDEVSQRLLTEIDEVSILVDRYHQILAQRISSAQGNLEGLLTETVDKARASTAHILNTSNNMPTEVREHLLTLYRDFTRTRCPTLASLCNRLLANLQEISAEQNKGMVVLALGDGPDWVIGSDVSEALSSALMHVIRNTIEHGYENRHNTDILVHVDKSPLITDSNTVEFIVWDEGRGLDLNRIEQKAVEKGLLNIKTADEELACVIFQPELSTAASVTVTSGRGMGMDVARSIIKKIDGQVNIEFRGPPTPNRRRPFQLRFLLPRKHIREVI